MSSIKMDLSGFKHVKTKNGVTTLKSPLGHSINLVHSALAEPNRKQLEALSNVSSEDETTDQKQEAKSPYGKVIKKFAGGGNTMQDTDGGASEDDSDTKPQAPVQIFVGERQGSQYANPQPGPTPEPGSYGKSETPGVIDRVKQLGQDFTGNPQPTGPTAMAPQEQPQSQGNAQQAPPPAAVQGRTPAAAESNDEEQPITQNLPSNPANNGPQQPQQMAQPAAPPPSPTEQHKQDIAHDLASELNNYKQDLAAGYIAPKTYHQLFADKSTLGKIGMIASLGLGGLGAALTHGPNVALDMINRTLDRDFQAQQKNQEYGLNVSKFGQMQQMQNEQIKKMGAERGWTDAQTNLAITKNKQESWALRRAQMNVEAIHHLASQIDQMKKNDPTNKNLPGMIQQFGMMSQAADMQNANILDQAASKSALMGSVLGGDAGNNDMALSTFGGPEGKAAVQYKQDRTVTGIPELEGQVGQNQPIPQAKRDALEAGNLLRTKVQEVQDFVKKNRLSPSMKVRAEGEQKAAELANYYNKSVDGLGMTQGRLAWLDEQIAKHPTGIGAYLFANDAKLNEIGSSNTTRMKNQASAAGLKWNDKAGKQQNEVRYDKQGNAWQKGPNGLPVRVK